MSILGLKQADFRLLADEILRYGHKVRFMASGESMQPFIQDGDILEIAPLAARKVKPGDVLLVDAGSERLLVHRVVKIDYQDNSPCYQVKGDNSSSPDGWYRIEKILGRVEIVERGDRRFVLTKDTQRWKSRIWVMISPWVSQFSWLPQNFRDWIRRCLSLN